MYGWLSFSADGKSHKGSFSSGHVNEALDDPSMENQFAREKRSESHILDEDSWWSCVGTVDGELLSESDQGNATVTPSEMKCSQERVDLACLDVWMHKSS